ncbi:MAG: hypothetical protein L0I80_02140 [Brevibacterium sp.]|uniref:hypothetical protein n=1 Tax=Brevibacterium sp. TaxID=1701 RepID=UPI00264859A2|nr:hypothetical protein [Brevibacterium sp.]MDN5806556.1 hypothetical protein [Brevibacterium sp.]MDN5833375.1 hypothetical protein [Brevibacterium sp.]MDN5875748.1 hypothetical protein [Brevibacterium sp.]MDN5908526.1 hypothetical protein [Brevibacterium sp.]MDN6122660.1 hypothetical protein [Brevibacterium sp.]
MFRIVTRNDLAELDMPRTDLTAALNCCLRRVRRGYYILMSDCSLSHFDSIRRLAQEPGTTFPKLRGDIRDEVEKLRIRIASRRESVLPGDVFSHVSAALIHGLDPVVTGTKRVEISRSAYSRKYPDLSLYDRDIACEDIARDLGYPVTSLPRTLADIALDHPLEVSVPLISEALRKSLIVRESLEPFFVVGTRGLKRARLALKLSDNVYESSAEAFCAVKFHRHGITGMRPQVTTSSSTGKFIGRNDFRHDSAPVIVEVHGIGKYYMHPSGPDDAARENHQRNMNLVNAGFRVFNLTFGDLFRPQIFAQIKWAITSALENP